MNTDAAINAGIAIVGMAGRFPKARNVDEFWLNLCNGVEGISFFTEEELEAGGAEIPKGNSNYVKARGILDNAGWFDAAFFGINPREAEVMDPQHRVFLECACEALDDAACDPSRFDGAIGVFAGMSMNTYLARNLLTRPELIAQTNEHQLMIGNDKDHLPTRVSYKLNLRGPSVNVQTACSTSLVAVCVACQNLLNYDCDLALAGAVSITFPQKRGYLFQEGGIASPDGHCRAFDAAAAGTVAGDGVAIVVLKRLEDALADHDQIYAVIKGFAMNNDGADKVGYTAPSVTGQAEVIATAQAMAGFPPDTIGYIEAHGTGTPLGDPIEIEGLTRAFRLGTNRNHFCAIGSVKSNLGHLDTAAGVAGLIKTALALHRKKIPPSLHFQSPNPKIPFADSPFRVNTSLVDWENGAAPRRAGVSSFGMGGTNAHVVLEESPATTSSDTSRPWQLLLLSAKTESALDQAACGLAKHLKQNPRLALADVAYTLQVGRSRFAHRRMVVCPDANEAADALEGRKANRMLSRAVTAGQTPLVFMFPGQGAQHANMARELYEHETVFRRSVERCCEMLLPHLGFDLRNTLYPEPGKIEEAQKQLAQTSVTQPALFVIEYALAQLWMDWGIQPRAMIGHSLGEYVAACLAGVFSLADALALVAARGRLMQQLPAGRMLAVRLPENEVRPLLNGTLSLAAVNAPSLCVVSGSPASMDMLQLSLAGRGAACIPLHTSHAFHSAMMEPVLQPYEKLVGQLNLSPPKIAFLSNLTGTWITVAQATDPNYWARHLRETVRFADGIGELFKEPGRVLLEVGPGRTLANLAKTHPARGPDRSIISTLGPANGSASDMESVATALGQLWLAGVEIDWRNYYQHEHRCRVSLPAYPFERKCYFVEPCKFGQRPAVSSTVELGDSEIEKAEVVPIRYSSTTEPAGPANTPDKLRTLLHELSGVNPATMDGTTTFAEMGLESLFLTQFSVAVEKKFGVRVAFRQLLEECSTLNALAAHIERFSRQIEAVPAENAETQISDTESNDTDLAPPAMIPLTGPQRELWLASQLSPAASCAYNECRLLTLRGNLRENTLRAAIETLMARHEALRTTFTSDGDFQHVKPAPGLDLPLLDWSKMVADARKIRLDALQHEEARLSFDLTSGPLIRGWVIRLEEQLHVLVLTVHHIVCDGNSMGILLRELAEIYSASCREAPDKLSAPPRWSEYAVGKSLENSAREADGEFWRKQFADEVPALELPVDHPRTSSWTFDGARASRPLPAALGAELKRIGARHGGTLFTTLLASYGILLHRLSGQAEIVIGIPVADRMKDGDGSLVGHCVNFLPLRLKLNGDETFEENLAQTQKAFLGAHEHQQYTLGHLLPTLDLSRDASRMPLTTVTFNVQQFRGGLNFEGLETELEPNLHSFTQFDLGFDVTDLGDTLQVNCRYNTNLFSAETIQRWLGHFQTLLEAIAAGSPLPAGRLPLLTPAERDQMLFAWNGPRTGYPREKTISQLFESQVEQTPDTVALEFGEATLTYRQLNGQSNRLARHLQKIGIGPGSMVAVSLERSADLPMVLLGILKSGGAYASLDPAYPKDRLQWMLEDLRAPVLITVEKFRTRFDFQSPALNPGSRLVCLDADRETLAALDPANLDNVVPAGSAAYVSFTSGSTGRPKGVVVPHRAVVRLVKDSNYARFAPDETFLQLAPVAFDASTFEIWGALLNGARLVVFPPFTPSLTELGEFIRRNQITTLWLTAGLFHQMIDEQLDNLAGARQLLAGGDVLSPPHVRRALENLSGCKIINGYGPTENTTFTCCHELSPADCEGRSIPIGRPVSNTQVYVLDRFGQPVPIGVPGELYAGGDGLALGYLNRSELTAEKFVPNNFEPDPAARLYKTGDLARWLPDGTIEFLGRIDEQVKIRGFRVEPGEIETVLNQHPAVRECAVSVRGGRSDEKQLVAYIVVKPESEISGITDSVPAVPSAVPGETQPEEEKFHGPEEVGTIDDLALRNFLQKKLPEYMIPSVFVPMRSLPLNANGKVNRRALPAPDARWLKPAQEFVAPRTGVETRLAEMWKEVLGLGRVGVNDHFFELGGNSLAAAKLAARIEKVFETRVSMAAVFESPTVAQFARNFAEDQ